MNDEVFLFNSRFAVSNFGHFVHDTLLQVPAYLELKTILPRLRPAIVARPLPFPTMKFLLGTLLGEENYSELLVLDAETSADLLIVPPVHFDVSTGFIDQSARRRLGDLLWNRIGRKLYAGETRRLFISRSDTAANMTYSTNSADVEEKLVAFGFEPLTLANMDPMEQATAFVNASIVVGEHGAGLTNAILSPGAHVVELAIRGTRDMQSIEMLLGGFVDRYERLWASSAQTESESFHWDVSDLLRSIGERQ